MAGSLVTYDISDKQPQVKAQMQSRGFLDYWTAANVTYHLPYSTLWHPKATPAEANAALIDVAAMLRVKLERAMTVQADLWAGIAGDAHR